ncbi:MAG TPA: glycosyltransferase [Acidisarcina sp.]|nr:glycosyltransferase [Acidisarcina sp.]
MKICFVVFGLTGRGGTETVILSTRREFLRRGHECMLVLLGGSDDRAWLQDVPAIELGSPSTPRILRYLQYAFRLPFLLKAFNPDVIFAVNSNGVSFISKLRRLLRLHAEIIFWPHWPLGPSEAEDMRLADYHFAISSGYARLLSKMTGDERHIHTVFNAIDIEVPPVGRSSTPVFLNVGRLQIQQQKCTDDLLRAAAMLKGDFLLRIVGSGKDEPALREMANDLGIADKVQWLGWKTDPWAAAGDASALVLCSSWEGLPTVLTEAIARGLPCISGDCPSGPEDIIVQGKNGWLVPPGDVPQLAAAMQHVIDHMDALPSPESVKATAKRFAAEPVVDRMIAAMQLERSSR